MNQHPTERSEEMVLQIVVTTFKHHIVLFVGFCLEGVKEFESFSLGGKLVAPLIATPNVDKCNRRQTRNGNRARLHAMQLITLMHDEYYSFCKQL